jgi:kynurenine formamidase
MAMRKKVLWVDGIRSTRPTGVDCLILARPLNVYHIENMTHLLDLPATGFQVIVAPINIGGGSRGPPRVFAFVR